MHVDRHAYFCMCTCRQVIKAVVRWKVAVLVIEPSFDDIADTLSNQVVDIIISAAEGIKRVREFPQRITSHSSVSAL